MFTLGDLIKNGLSLWARCRDCGKVRWRSPSSICVPRTTTVYDVRSFMKCGTCGSGNIETAIGGPLEANSVEGGKDAPDAGTGFGALYFEPRGATKGDGDAEEVFD